MRPVGAVVRHKTEGEDKLGVARIKRDRRITQQPDGHSEPIHERRRGRERGEKSERGRGKDSSKDRTRQETTKSHAGLDGDNVPHGVFGWSGGLGSMPL